jgi:hypothetical protein
MNPELLGRYEELSEFKRSLVDAFVIARASDGLVLEAMELAERVAIKIAEQEAGGRSARC